MNFRFDVKAVLLLSLAIPVTQVRAQSCLPWPLPSTLVPFSSVYEVTTPNTSGDRLIVGQMSMEVYAALRSQLPLPSTLNQEICRSIEMAPGVYAQAYVPTAAEWSGDFSAFAGPVPDPVTYNPVTGRVSYFAGGIIPMSRIPSPFAWRIRAQTAAPSGTHLRFIPVTPCRVADTRNAGSAFGGPPLAGQTTRDFTIPSGSCGIPFTSQAYSLNVTVIPQETLNYITVFPAGQQQPLASTLNSYDGRVKANAAIVPAGANGAISVFTTDTTHLIIDINGYFVPDSDTAALAFFPITPCRVADTRGAAGPFGAPSLAAGQERVFPVLMSNCGVPSTAQAYSLNYTVVPKSPLDYLTTWPTGQIRPTVSTLNATTGSITANAAIVPAGEAGNVSIYATQQTEVVLDINGYFAPRAAGGLSLYSLTPCRLYDSRLLPGAPPLVNTTVVNVAGVGCGVPATAQSLVLNSTVVPTNSLLYLSLWASGGADKPTVSALNAPDGAVTSNLALVPTVNGSVSAYASDSTHLILDLYGYFAP